MEKKVIKVGNLSIGNSQAGTIYGSWGASPTLCAGSHGYAIGYIVVERKKHERDRKKRNKLGCTNKG